MKCKSGVLVKRHTALSRTVIDVNRDPSGASLYPGQVTTGLVPAETFDGRPLYREGAAPTSQEIERRMEQAGQSVRPDQIAGNLLAAVPLILRATPAPFVAVTDGGKANEIGR